MRRMISSAVAAVMCLIATADAHAQAEASIVINSGEFAHREANVYDVSVDCAMVSSQPGLHTITLYEVIEITFPGGDPVWVRFRTILIKQTGRSYAAGLAGTIEYDSAPGGIRVEAVVSKNGVPIGSSNFVDIDIE